MRIRCHRFFPTLMLGLALSGCQNMQGVFPSRDTLPTGHSTNFATPTPTVDGAGGVDTAELPRKKKADVCLIAARIMEANGQHAKAIEHYDQVRQLEPNLDNFCTKHLAVLHDRVGNFDKALDEYQRALKQNPKDAEVYNDLGYGYYSRGHWEPAVKQFRSAVQLDPKNQRAWSNLGMSLAQLGRYDEGLSAFEKVVNRPQALCNIAYIQAAQGKRDMAKDSYAYALKLEPGLQKARAALQALDNPTSRVVKRGDRKDSKERALEMEAKYQELETPKKLATPPSNEFIEAIVDGDGPIQRVQPTSSATMPVAIPEVRLPDPTPARITPVSATKRYEPPAQIAIPEVQLPEMMPPASNEASAQYRELVRRSYGPRATPAMPPPRPEARAEERGTLIEAEGSLPIAPPLMNVSSGVAIP